MEIFHDFSLLFPDDMRAELLRAEDDGIGFAIIDSIPVFYRGVLPKDKCVLLVSFLSSERVLCDMYVSALEAASSEIDIVSIGDRGGMLSVIRGAEDGEGRMHMVISEGMRSYEKNYGWKLRKILLTGGSVISPLLWGRDEGLARSIALSLSSSAIMAAGGKRLPGTHPLISAIDMGLDTAVLRSSLTEEAMRNIVREGCPAVGSYSSFVEYPQAIAYPSENGYYGFHGSRFGIMRMQWD